MKTGEAPRGDAPPLLVRDYFFSFGGKAVLRGVSFELRAGELLAVTGPNGAGKTTLLKSLMRILPPGSGEIAVFGRPLRSYRQLELARRLSYVPQGDGRSLPFTVREFVRMGRYPHRRAFAAETATDRAAVTRALEQTGTAAFAARRLDTLSGGERQKVVIAAALAQEAKVLLLDEPTTFLDPGHQEEVHALLRRVCLETGAAALVAGHDLNAAALTADRVLALKGGVVVFLGLPEQFMDNTVLKRVYGKSFIFAPHPRTGRRIVVPDDPRAEVGDTSRPCPAVGAAAATDAAATADAVGTKPEPAGQEEGEDLA